MSDKLKSAFGWVIPCLLLFGIQMLVLDRPSFAQTQNQWACALLALSALESILLNLFVFPMAVAAFRNTK